MIGDLSVGKFGYQIQFLKLQLDFTKVESDPCQFRLLQNLMSHTLCQSLSLPIFCV